MQSTQANTVDETAETTEENHVESTQPKSTETGTSETTNADGEEENKSLGEQLTNGDLLLLEIFTASVLLILCIVCGVCVWIRKQKKSATDKEMMECEIDDDAPHLNALGQPLSPRNRGTNRMETVDLEVEYEVDI